MKIIDLSVELYDHAPTMPMDPKMSVTPHCTLETLGYNLSRVTLSTHQGTHMDMPYHFFYEGDTLSELDLNRCVCRAFKAELRYKKPGEPIGINDLLPYEDKIDDGLSVLLHTGWDEVFPLDEFFSKFPYITVELGMWFAEKKVNLVGMDMPRPNGVEWKRVYEDMLGAKIILVEGLANMEKLPEGEFTFIALPLKLRKLDGSPVRAVAMTD